MRRFMVPLILSGLLAADQFAVTQAVDAARIIRVRPHVLWSAPLVPPLRYRVDADTLNSLQDDYQSAKAVHDEADDRWDAIKDACKGDDDDADMMVTPEQCADAKMAADVTKERYDRAKDVYMAVRSPVVYDPWLAPSSRFRFGWPY